MSLFMLHRLKIGTYVPLTKQKMDSLLIQMFSSFIADVRQLIATTCALFVYDKNQSNDDDADMGDLWSVFL